jgi:hypothetical protein
MLTLYPPRRMPALAHKRTHAAQQMTLFDHFVGVGKQRRRHCEAECLRGLKVDYHFELCRLLNWKIGKQNKERQRRS